MNAFECARALAGPVGDLGGRFYFAPATRERAKELGLRGVEYYGLGRAGVMGDIEPAEVQAAFAFFSASAIERIYGAARAKMPAVEAARHYLESADEYARVTYGGLGEAVLERVVGLGGRVVSVAPRGRYRLFDGYCALSAPPDAPARAYRVLVELRELRGGVFIDAVLASGLSPADASYLDDPENFARHGFVEADLSDPRAMADFAPRRAVAEASTDAAMAVFYDVLSDAERDELVDGVATLAATE